VFAFATALSGKIFKLLLANHNIIAIYIPNLFHREFFWEIRELEKILDAGMNPNAQVAIEKALSPSSDMSFSPKLTILPTYITRVALVDSKLKRY
jgi:hypothetical protein